MTDEQINKQVCSNFFGYDDTEYRWYDLADAYEQGATWARDEMQKEMFGFVEWIDDNYWSCDDNPKKYQKPHDMGGGQPRPNTPEYNIEYTIAELYEIFKNQQP